MLNETCSKTAPLDSLKEDALECPPNKLNANCNSVLMEDH
jgi:hypothetical protein